MNNCNIVPSTIFTGDNLPILQGMNSESIDLIYLDPPFNSNKNYSAPIGSKAAGAAFKDTWTLDDVDVAWVDMVEEASKPLSAIIKSIGLVRGKGTQSYLTYMAIRLIELHRILKPTGSLYLHCDTAESHSIKLLMDSIFGKNRFRNEIVWCYTGPGNAKRDFPRKHDIIFRYVKTETWTFNGDSIKIPYKKLETGKTSGIFSKNHTLSEKGKIPESWWSNFSPVGRLKNERMNYPTQKPLALLKRIIKASSNDGDLILDPFCGCATACVSAEEQQRKWIGIDISPLARKLIIARFKKQLGLLNPKIIERADIPHRTDLGKVTRYNAPENKRLLYGSQQGDCAGCKVHFEYRNMAIDHKTPRSKGGGDNIQNLQLLCPACNSTKGGGTMPELIAKLRKQGIIKL